MAYYYSLTTKGWYDTNFANYNLPEDAIELTEEQWTTLRVHMNTGLELVLNAEGELEWVEPVIPIADIKASKSAWLRQQCSEEIERTSFASSALGSVHNYDCRIVDQINLKIRYDVASFNGQPEPIWASDGTRYEWKSHTSAQLIAVLSDMNDHIKSSQVNLATKLAAVDAATTASEVQAITW